jgi:hypothetical protein
MKQQPIFIKTFGNYPLIRVFDFLIYSRDFDYPITEIAKNAGVHFQTFQKIWPTLVKEKMVISTRELSGTTLYKINIQHPVVKKLIELNTFLCMQYAHKGILCKI